MGKSPGKWIKSVLFGRKVLKSNSSKRREIPKSAFEKPLSAPTEEPVSSLAVAESFTIETAPVNIAGEIENPESGNDEVSEQSNELTISSSNGEGNAQAARNNDLQYDSDRIHLEQAATKAQATFRGYLARRAFRTLKGIIRLQAVIRGHLVRRQAVATLYCVHGIVKFQALVRGQMIRHSASFNKVRGKQSPAKRDASLSESGKANTYNQQEKLLGNAFVRQLLSSSPTAIPLRLQYEPGEPNSAWNWLLRWTMSHVWLRRCEPKKAIDLKQKVGQKRSGQRKQSAIVENASARPTLESVKLKHNTKRASNQLVKSVQEQPRKEINKVKNNPKKISKSADEIPVQKDIKSEKPKPNHSKSSNLQDYSVDEVNGHPVADVEHKELSDKKETATNNNRDINSMEEQATSENLKIRKRRVSLPAKCDDQETKQRGTRVRSYMAATESAKAKVRGQASPRLDQDLTEKKGITRRHSLPSSINEKVSSPRVQGLIHTSGKGGAQN